MGNVKHTIIDIFVILYLLWINHVQTAQFLSIVHVLFFQYLHEPMIFFRTKISWGKSYCNVHCTRRKKRGHHII